MKNTALSVSAYLSLVLAFVAATVSAQMAKPTTAAPAEGVASEGQKVADFPFGEVVGGDVKTKLSEHKGDIVLFAEFQDIAYGGIEAAHVGMKLEEKFGKQGLVVYLLDCNDGWSKAKAKAFLYKKFPGYDARVMNKVRMPITTAGGDTPPRIVLIGADGTLLLEGSFRNKGGKLEKTVAAEAARRKSGWGTDPQAKKIRALAFGQGKLAEARAVAEAVKSPSEETKQAAGEVEDYFSREVARAAELVRLARYGDSESCLLAVEKGTGNVQDWNEMLKVAKTELASFADAKKRDVEKALNALEAQVQSGKCDAGHVKKAKDIAKANAGTELALRAERLAAVADELVK